MADPVVILHLSDLHFGEASRFSDRDPDRLGEELGGAVLSELRGRESGARTSLVVVTGDIAQSAKPKEYETARLFLQSLVGALGVESGAIVLTPGNHDVSWPLCEIEVAQQKILDFDEAELRRRMDEKRFAFYTEFATALGAGSAANRQTPLFTGADVLDFDFGVSIAALNSCEIESHRDNDHKGVVSADQSQALLDHWGPCGADDTLRIIAVHHNPVPPVQAVVDEWRGDLDRLAADGKLNAELATRLAADMRGLEGTDALKQAARQTGTVVLLHGHNHTANENAWPWGNHEQTHVLGAGSFGLKDVKRPQDWPNQVRLVVLDSEAPELRAYSLVFYPTAVLGMSVTPGAFVSDPAQPKGYKAALGAPRPAAAPKSRRGAPPATTATGRFSKTLRATPSSGTLRYPGACSTSSAATSFWMMVPR